MGNDKANLTANNLQPHKFAFLCLNRALQVMEKNRWKSKPKNGWLIFSSISDGKQMEKNGMQKFLQPIDYHWTHS